MKSQNNDNEFHIENPKRSECPTCGSVYAISNLKEIIFRKITFVHINEETKEKTIKCKKCKSMIKINP